jgi:hypothetical protein
MRDDTSTRDHEASRLVLIQKSLPALALVSRLVPKNHKKSPDC